MAALLNDPGQVTLLTLGLNSLFHLLTSKINQRMCMVVPGGKCRHICVDCVLIFPRYVLLVSGKLNSLCTLTRALSILLVWVHPPTMMSVLGVGVGCWW